MCSKLQYRGDGAEVRVEIAAELKALAADDSAVLPVPPNLDVARANELVLPEFTTGEWPPQTRPRRPVLTSPPVWNKISAT